MSGPSCVVGVGRVADPDALGPLDERLDDLVGPFCWTSRRDPLVQIWPVL